MKNNEWRKGFTLIELLLSISIFTILIGIITLNLNTAQHKASIQKTVETLLTDLSQQQMKAMVGDTEGRGTLDNYGIHISSNSYTLFHGTYNSLESSNFLVDLPDIFQFDSSSRSEIIFKPLSGEIDQFSIDSNQIIIRDITNGDTKTIELNRLGVVTGMN